MKMYAKNIVMLIVAAGVVFAQPVLVTAQAGGESGVVDSSGDVSLDALDGLSDEERNKMIMESIKQRLQLERDQVAVEIRRGLLFSDSDETKALKLLVTNPANTQKDNFARILAAFAIVDKRFAKAYKLFHAKKYPEAVVAAQRSFNMKKVDCTYLSAAKVYLLAAAMEKSGKHYKAIGVFDHILEYMPDRVSIATAAAIRIPIAFEKKGRWGMALRGYKICLLNYGMMLPNAQAKEMISKIIKYEKVYKDPFGTLTNWIGVTQRRLAAVDSGKQTRNMQKEIVTLLEDIIKTAEEKSQKPPQKAKKQKKGEKKGGKPKPGKNKGKKKGKPKPKKSQKGMQESILTSASDPGGKLAESGGRSKVRTGEWAELPPRQKQKIEQIRRKSMPERYRTIISDYHTRMAEE